MMTNATQLQARRMTKEEYDRARTEIVNSSTRAFSAFYGPHKKSFHRALADLWSQSGWTRDEIVAKEGRVRIGEVERDLSK